MTRIIDAFKTGVIAGLLLSLLIVALQRTIEASQEGFILRGVLENATSDGTHYFKLGEAFVFMLPKDSALVSGLRPLEGRKVVISIFEDK